MIMILKVRTMLVASNIGKKINVWTTNKYSNELHIAAAVAFNVPSISAGLFTLH